MSKLTTTIRVTLPIRTLLRRISAETGETFYAILWRLLSAEWYRLRHERTE